MTPYWLQFWLIIEQLLFTDKIFLIKIKEINS